MKIKHFAIAASAVVPFGIWAIFSAPTEIKECMGFLNPWDNMNKEGFQIVQASLAFQKWWHLRRWSWQFKAKAFLLARGPYRFYTLDYCRRGGEYRLF